MLRPLGALTLGLVAGAACSDGSLTLPRTTEPVDDLIPSGEICSAPDPEQVRVRVQPASLVLAPGARRTVRVVVDPDFCSRVLVVAESSDEALAAVTPQSIVRYGAPSALLEVVAGDAAGRATLTVRVPRGDGGEAVAEVRVDVRDAAPVACDASDDVMGQRLNAGGEVAGAASLTGASLALPERADMPNDNAFVWSVSAFDADVRCAADLDLPGHRSLGPAVTFGPEARAFPRDLPMTVPINPAGLPEQAELRHVGVAYSGPHFKAPRVVPVADMRLVEHDGGYALAFKAPRLGTYQAVVSHAAGSKKIKRRLTHRAVVGVSMGGLGAAQFGLRHHHLFDVVAALGGPVDWTYLYDHIENNHMAGFRPIASGTTLDQIQLEKTPCSGNDGCAADETCLGAVDGRVGRCTLLPVADEPYEHASTFNNWWYEYPRQGHGGSFDRRQYIQIFRDLAIMYGNPNGHNELPGAENLPAGVDPSHPSVAGEDGRCGVWVEPYDAPDKDEQKLLEATCPAERCANTLVLNGYYDDEFNPDGTFPVITFCDGTEQDGVLTPYANTWTPDGQTHPMEVALAVDYNGNGRRDELEPLIRAGHERWDDHGVDGVPSELEPGYSPDNLDPAGDDYDAQYNPAGTENDRRWQPGEPYADTGLDGVFGTTESPYDHGEGDGLFTMSKGLRYMLSQDPHGIVRRFDDAAVPSGPLDDQGLARLDFWTDGGTRDLFNSHVAAAHLAGTFAARGRNLTYYSALSLMPGLDPAAPLSFDPVNIVWDQVPGVVYYRYGKDEPTALDVEVGSGQHVGTATEITQRIQAALYFIGSRWPDTPVAQHAATQDSPADDIPDCHITNSCTFDFTASDGRTGPVGVTLPPGYGHADLQHVRYPVIYMLHGYGMTPEDLLAAIAFLGNWMNSPAYSQASRLSKAILVYVDGRCRRREGEAECVRGTFFTDSLRTGGPQMDTWWLELMDHIDRSYRTMGESVVEHTE